MKTLKIYGASDDLIETEGIEGCDEFSTHSPSKKKIEIRAGSVKPEGLDIWPIYTGSWAFAITAPFGDYDEYPAWPIRRYFGGESSHSETIEIDVPDDATLAMVNRKSEEWD
jgi:hypothetical protein